MPTLVDKIISPVTLKKADKDDCECEAVTIELEDYLDSGANKWHKPAPFAEKGTRQSPVSINTEEVLEISKLPRLDLTYGPSTEFQLINTGKTWQLYKELTENCNYSLAGGPLHTQYRLLQIHAHWGEEGTKGSEHIIDGKQYSAEIHLVHYNTKYPNLEVAFHKPDGLAVVGVLIEVEEEASPHPELEKICAHLDKLQMFGEKVCLETEIDPSGFLPQEKDYFMYDGSLTSPAYYECVTWILLKKPIIINRRQLASMATMKDCSEDCFITNNFRHTYPLGTRKVKLVKEDGGVMEARIEKEKHLCGNIREM